MAKAVFETKGSIFKFDLLLPKEFYYSLEMTILLLRRLGMELIQPSQNLGFLQEEMAIFKGIKNTTLVDSSYNANLDSMTAILNMFDNIKLKKMDSRRGYARTGKKSEESEHEKLTRI